MIACLSNRLLALSVAGVYVYVVDPGASPRFRIAGPGCDYARADRRSEFEHFILYEVINRCEIKKFDSNSTGVSPNHNSPYIVATEVIPVGNP